MVLQRLQLPDKFPAATFDLITFCKVGCCLNQPDLARTAALIAAALPVGGQLLLAHWMPPVHNYPLTGDEVHEFFMQGTGPAGPWRRLTGQRHSQYWLDVLEKK